MDERRTRRTGERTDLGFFMRGHEFQFVRYLKKIANVIVGIVSQNSAQSLPKLPSIKLPKDDSRTVRQTVYSVARPENVEPDLFEDYFIIIE